ncbi:chromate transporter [Carnobacterium alterfunditum]|uniref:chromate transporter n=1 Tax=Carnobacterium alterfunditum TaxID=28230 RepID=UPI003593761F
MIYLQLFWSFFQVGALSFGGGYAALPLIQEQVIDKNDWLTNTEYIDVLTISQMTPGPIALNASTFVGTKVAGISGSIFATLGCITPSVIIVLVLAVFYYKYKGLSLVQGVIKGLRPAVVALIGSAGLSILLTALFNKDTLPIEWAKLDLVSLVLFIVGLVLLRKTKINPIYVMLAAGLARLIIYGVATL